MSSLRVDSLRLVWLEAYLEAANCQNLSEAARNLGLDQSTMSRYIQALGTWLGRDLFYPLTAAEEGDPTVSISETAESRRFYARAKVIVRALHQFRHEDAVREEAFASMTAIAAKLTEDLRRKKRLKVTITNLDELEHWLHLYQKLDVEAPLQLLRYVNTGLRIFFRRYEGPRSKELMARKRIKNAKGTKKPDAGLGAEA